MQIRRATDTRTVTGDASTFTGHVRIDSLLSAPDPVTVGTGVVSFDPEREPPGTPTRSGRSCSSRPGSAGSRLTAVPARRCVTATSCGSSLASATGTAPARTTP
jgi:hypothetical protein